VAIENLSLEEIEQQLAQLAQDRLELENALEQRRQQGKYELAEQIKAMIAEQGYAVGVWPQHNVRKEEPVGAGLQGPPEAPRRPVYIIWRPHPAVVDITSLLAGRKRRGAAAKSRVARQYTVYADPDYPSHVYTRGMIPGWMKAKMQEQGYDPGSKTDRETFKANVLKAVA
jgi:DNA-binding protein H-NS